MPALPGRRLLAAACVAVLVCLAPLSIADAANKDTDGDGLTNAFELHHSHTDPNKADTDGNGLPDSMEDPDGDGLSNLGEQSFGTNPLNPDTDGNGTPDSQEDSDHNGVPKGLQQDRRHVPNVLVPSLAAAPTDHPVSYSDGCHVGAKENHFRHCRYAVTSRPHTVALFGDSHAAQWLPALIVAAKHLGWAVLNLTGSACPAADVTVWSVFQNGPATWCNTYRQ